MVKRKNVMIAAINIMLLALSIPLPHITSQDVNQPNESPALISTFPNLAYQRRYIDPELSNSTGHIRVLVVASKALPIREVAKHMITCRATPSFGSFYVIAGSIYAEKVQQLASNPLIFSILRDRKVEYPIPTDLPDISSLKVSLKKNVASRLTFEMDAFSGKPETTLRDVVNLTGAKKTWEDLGINGTGVTIAILDTGVDYGSMGLGNWDAMARDKMGYPAAFDPDAQCVVLTNLTVTQRFALPGRGTFLNTTGVDPLVYFPFFGPPWVFKWSDLTGIQWPFSMNITGIYSASGNYRFGIMFQLGLAWHTGYIDIFPVLVVDSITPGLYDKVYVDLSFDWAIQGLGPMGWPGFADETPVTIMGRTVAARDFNKDGYYDISAGSLAYFLDVWGVSPNKADRGLILKPLDPAGNYTVFENDWYGHGTSCAESAAGRDKVHLFAGPGIAPGAKVMGIVGLWIGDIIEGELWAAGFDLIPETEGWSPFIPSYGWVYGTWNYTGNHKADIISNSWGFSAWPPWLYGLPWYDLLTILEDALTVPGYLHPDYPGTIIVHAGGNGASGFGTVTGPAYGTLPITVGASTSLNYYKQYGYKGGYHDEIISWSARGPTPLGNVKPDVVNIGAGGWVSRPVWAGGGNGSSAYGLFGGTSMATPLTAGASALIIQAYKQAYGTPPTPETVKVILKSSAKDLGYNAFLQGSGRVDCFAATELALKKTGVTVASPATWNVQQASVQHAWAFYQGSLGDPLAFKPPMGPISDTGWFAGNVKPGSSSFAEFAVKNPTVSAVSGKIAPMVYEQVSVKRYADLTGPVLGTRWGYIALLSLSEIPMGTDLMTVTLMVPYAYFDVGYNYTYERNFAVFITDWNDTNADSKVDLNELYVINLGYNAGTSCEAQMSLPLSKFKHQPVVVVRQYEDFSPVPFQVYIRYFKRTSWTWVTAPSSIRVNASSSSTFTATLTVPLGTPQGVYEGLIVVNITGSYTKNVIIPVSLKVPAILLTSDLALNLTPPATPMLYDSYRVNGYFDWGWRYESGDWKTWAFDIQDPTVVAAFVSCKWTGNMTDIDMVGINPAGFITDAALSPTLGSDALNNRRFMWRTRTGAHEEYVILDTNMIFHSMPGVYTVLLHNVLFDGAMFPENVTGKVELVKLAPRGPIDIVTKAGKTVSQGFTITTGKALKNVDFFTYYPYSPFSVEFNPSVVSNINAMGSANITVNVDIPAGTQEGTYMVILMLSADEIPFPALVLLNITVDNTPPTVNMISPTGGEILGGTVEYNTTIEAYASDPSGIDKVEFKVGATSTAMTFDSTTGTWKGYLNTGRLPDGATTVNVTATDKAGNVGHAIVTFIVDNTPPSVSITTPAAGAELLGTVPIQFTASDINLDKVLLYIDNAMFDVTGTTSYSWNTAALGDGSHTVRLVATDKAGNSAQTSRAVTTINVRRAIEDTRNTYLAVGLPIGLVVGILIGYAFLKRKLKP